MRRAAKTDGNQAEIVEAAEWAGATTALTYQLGEGFPDAVFGIDNLFNLMIEIKTARGKLTGPEEKFHISWGGQLDIIRTPEQMIALIRKYQQLGEWLKGSDSK